MTRFEVSNRKVLGIRLEVLIKDDGLTVETDGLSSLCGYELMARVSEQGRTQHCVDLVKFVANYIVKGNVIRSGETLRYGYWITQLILDDRGRMVFFENSAEASESVFGVELTLAYWEEQHKICDKVGAAFSPPLPHQMVVISDGVYDGDEVQGVRYPSPDHMTGWWLTTDRYDGSVKSLKTVHIHHVSARRPDLAKFFALPFGYRFFSPQSDVWFDKKVAEQS